MTKKWEDIKHKSNRRQRAEARERLQNERIFDLETRMDAIERRADLGVAEEAFGPKDERELGLRAEIVSLHQQIRLRDERLERMRDAIQDAHIAAQQEEMGV